MKITHVAIWTNNLERLQAFYCRYFGGTSNEKYTNPVKKFSSYFLTFEHGSCSLELMNKPDLVIPESYTLVGLAHFAFSVGSKEQVDLFTSQLREAGYTVIGEPRWTGDGFYESAITDPDGNTVEITI